MAAIAPSLAVEPLALVGVYDSRLCGTRTRAHLYQFVFLCRPRDPDAVLARAWSAAAGARGVRQFGLPGSGGVVRERDDGAAHAGATLIFDGSGD